MSAYQYQETPDHPWEPCSEEGYLARLGPGRYRKALKPQTTIKPETEIVNLKIQLAEARDQLKRDSETITRLRKLNEELQKTPR